MTRFKLFDCDDTLVRSETLAFQACTTVVNGLLEKKGVFESDGSLKLFTPDQLKKRFVGHSFREIIISLSQEYPQFTLTDDEVEQLVAAELAAVIAKLKTEVAKTPGVYLLLSEYTLQHDTVLAVVSSSAMPRVLACLERSRLIEFFGERVFSAASLTPPTSKPDPAVYLEAMRALGAKPEQCEAFEDSVSGVTAAVRAGIKVLGYVGALPSTQQMVRKEALLKAGAYDVIYHWDELWPLDARPLTDEDGVKEAQASSCDLPGDGVDESCDGRCPTNLCPYLRGEHPTGSPCGVCPFLEDMTPADLI